jgi:hypothetical protein
MFKKATKEGAHLRMALFGAAGTGKTKTALRLGKLFGNPALIDTEHGSASKYSDEFEFDTCELHNFSPEDYTKAIKEAQGYKTLIIDSLSHGWNGKGGALELVDRFASSSGNKFTGWKDVTPMQSTMIETILGFAGHVIVTLRSKSDYVLESYQDKHGNTKSKPVKIGLAPIQREGVEYEFDIVCRLESNHDITVVKSRCPALDDKVLPAENAYELLYQELTTWLGEVKEEPKTEMVNIGGGVLLETEIAQPDWSDLTTVGKENRWPSGYIKQWIEDQKKAGDTPDNIYARGMAKFSQTNAKVSV